MRIEKAQAVELLAPLLPSMAHWWPNALDRFMTGTSVEDRMDLGSNARATIIQRYALANMRKDPAIGNFQIIESNQLEALTLAGEGSNPNVCILLNKVRRDPFGNLRIAPNATYRHLDRESGQLELSENKTIPLVSFYELVWTGELVHPKILRIGIGEQSQSGFHWTYPIWVQGEEAMPTVAHSEPPLFPEPKIRLRKPAALRNETTIGTRQEDERRRKTAHSQDDAERIRGGA